MKEYLFNAITCVEYLEKLSKAYYEGNPIVSDEEYDRVEEDFKNAFPAAYTVWMKKTREAGAKFYGTKRKHLYGFIGSIGKIKVLDDSKLNEKERTISAKLDGTSMTVYYKNGELLYALTRGDGVYGFDVTDKYLEITKKYKMNIPLDFTGAIRGEVVMSVDTWNIYKKNNPDAKMPRNVGTGLIQRDGISEDLKYLDFVVCQIPAYEGYEGYDWFMLKSELDIIKVFYFGLPIVPYRNFSESVSFEKLEILKNQWSEIYPLDGLVFSHLIGVDFQDKIQKPTSYLEAFKFQAEIKETKVLGVEWNLQKSGKLIPVVLVEPTELSGATVNRATGNNAENIIKNKIGTGAIVELERSNEVIPKIGKIRSEALQMNVPTKCPSCDSFLITRGVHLVCENDNCPDKKKLLFEHFLRVCGGEIKGAGTSIYSLLSSFGSFSDLLTAVNYHEIYLNTTKHQKEILNQIKKNIFEHMTYDNLLKAVNPEGAGDKAISVFCEADDGKLVERYFAKHVQVEEVLERKLKGLGPAAIKAIFDLQNLAHDYYCILNMLFIEIKHKEKKVASNKGQIRYYCVTGTLSMPRKRLEQMAAMEGWEQASISKAEFLVTNDQDSGSSKNVEAQRLNKKIISENQFIEEYLNGDK